MKTLTFLFLTFLGLNQAWAFERGEQVLVEAPSNACQENSHLQCVGRGTKDNYIIAEVLGNMPNREEQIVVKYLTTDDSKGKQSIVTADDLIKTSGCLADGSFCASDWALTIGGKGVQILGLRGPLLLVLEDKKDRIYFLIKDDLVTLNSKPTSTFETGRYVLALSPSILCEPKTDFFCLGTHTEYRYVSAKVVGKAPGNDDRVTVEYLAKSQDREGQTDNLKAKYLIQADGCLLEKSYCVHDFGLTYSQEEVSIIGINNGQLLVQEENEKGRVYFINKEELFILTQH